MTKKEAEMYLYNFLRKNGIVNRYYYNCIFFNDCGRSHDRKQFLKLKPRERLKAIMSSHVKEYRGSTLLGFFDARVSSFAWDESPEGYSYWHKWWDKWYEEVSKLEEGKTVIEI
jgi:retron-type reverse transcriptase